LGYKEKIKDSPTKNINEIAMVFCANCGARLEEENRFCPECGSKVEEIVSTQPQQAVKEETVSHTPQEPTKTQGVLERIRIDREDIGEVTEEAKKRLGSLGRFARKGLGRGAELASQRIEAAKEKIQERRDKPDKPDREPQSKLNFCPDCGTAINEPANFCNNCGQKLE
jgi:uncharacterized OB-fold protein